MKTYRYLPLITVIALLLVCILAFAACGNGNETSADETTPAADSTSTEDTSTENTTETTSLEETTTTTPDTEEAEPVWVNAIFGGGPFTTSGISSAQIIKNTDYNTLMLWSVHVHENGDLYMNDIPIVKNGELVSKSVARNWEYLRTNCPNITRIELSVGAWGTPDFENIKKLIDRNGTGEDTILYKNFKCLVEATGAHAVNFDDESLYDVDVMSKFGKMCVNMGCKVTFCPFRSMDFWYNLYTAIGKEHVDRIYVQHYDGGMYNNPLDWARKFGCDIIPGYWGRLEENKDKPDKGQKTPEEILQHLKQYQNVCCGGFMWLFDEMQSNGTADDYASAITQAGEGKKWD